MLIKTMLFLVPEIATLKFDMYISIFLTSCNHACDMWLIYLNIETLNQIVSHEFVN